MSSKLEQVLELLINEEREAAEELLHDFIVENARQIHEDLLNESDEVVDEELEELDEADDYVDDEDSVSELEDDASEIENEEFYDADEMEDEEAVDDLEMGDDVDSEEGVEARVDDLESALAELEAEFEKIMAGDDEDDMEDDAEMDMDMDMDAEDDMEESFELELEESDDDDLDLEESDDDAEDEDKLDEYVTPVSASAGDNGDNTASTVNANAKRPGDDSNAAPVKANDGNTSGGKGDAPKDMSTKNVNVSGNSKAPAMSNQAAKPGDNGVNNKSITS
jgi:hypothetical protein